MTWWERSGEEQKPEIQVVLLPLSTRKVTLREPNRTQFCIPKVMEKNLITLKATESLCP